MRWLFIIDPLEKLNPETDTTYALMKECSRRNIGCFIAEIKDLLFDNKAKVSSSELTFKNAKYFIGNTKVYAIDDFDIIFMRKEPPYDIAFHYATNLLSLSKKIVVNNPRALRDFNEKLIILNFPKLIPKTLVTSNENRIINFIKDNEYAILKALDSYQGKFIRRLSKNDKSLKEKISKMTSNGRIPIMAQEFINNVYKGDKRILILGGKIIGTVSRVPKKGSFVSNFAQGGKGVKTMITEDDKSIANSISNFLVQNGIHFAGLDVIDGRLTEINITCPTGVMQINIIENKQLERKIVDYFEKLK